MSGLISNGFISKLTGILSTSVLPEEEKEALLDKIPVMYTVEAQELYEMLMDNQLCPITQLAHFSNKAVHARLDKIIVDERK